MPGFSGCLQLPGKPYGSCMSWGSVGFYSGSQVTFPFWRSLFLLYLLGEPHGWSHFTSQALSRWFPYSSVELLFQPEGKWSPRRPSTHIIWIPKSPAVTGCRATPWEPYGGLCPQCPLLEISYKPRFRTAGHSRWQISSLTIVPSLF